MRTLLGATIAAPLHLAGGPASARAAPRRSRGDQIANSRPTAVLLPSGGVLESGLSNSRHAQSRRSRGRLPRASSRSRSTRSSSGFRSQRHRAIWRPSRSAIFWKSGGKPGQRCTCPAPNSAKSRNESVFRRAMRLIAPNWDEWCLSVSIGKSLVGRRLGNMFQPRTFFWTDVCACQKEWWSQCGQELKGSI